MYNILHLAKRARDRLGGMGKGLLHGETAEIDMSDEPFPEISARRPISFINADNKSVTAGFIKKIFPDKVNAIIDRADAACDHEFDLLGSGSVKLGEKIDWHRDFKSGYRWDEKKSGRLIEIPFGKADIKIPWELSRFQHSSDLGRAYWLTGDEKYAEEFMSQVEDWINNNPPGLGVNWACAMDVAIRAANWVLGYGFFRDSKKVTNDFRAIFFKSLLSHGRHIMNNLENRNGFTFNHYLSDLAGLIYISSVFQGFQEAKKWKDFGVKEITAEMEKQVYDDGCDFEASTYYHRLVLEFFLFAALLVVVNDKNFDGVNYEEILRSVFGGRYTEKLHDMFRVVLHTLKPDGRMPQIGDNDNGRLHLLGTHENQDMRYLLPIGALLFGDGDLKVDDLGFCQEAAWIFGEEGYKRWNGMNGCTISDISSRAFPDSGWYVMRSDKNYMIISCGPNGLAGNGGHCHNDKLSFELHVNGEDIITDPGTYLYTSDPKARNLFRSTGYHNTITINGAEQNRFNEWFLFKMRDESLARCTVWSSAEGGEVFSGEHCGFRGSRILLRHTRHVRFSRNKAFWTVKDELTHTAPAARKKKTPLSYRWNFHLAPHVVPEKRGSGEFLFRGRKAGLVFRITGSSGAGYRSAIEDGWISPEYGVRVAGKVLAVECEDSLPFYIEFEMRKVDIKNDE